MGRETGREGDQEGGVLGTMTVRGKGRQCSTLHSESRVASWQMIGGAKEEGEQNHLAEESCCCWLSVEDLLCVCAAAALIMSPADTLFCL